MKEIVMKFTQKDLERYASPLSATENEMCKRAIRQVRDVLSDLGYTDDNKEISLLAEDTLAYTLSMRSTVNNHTVDIFIQGSYANNTCISGESDVDIAVVRKEGHDYVFNSSCQTGTTDKKLEAAVFKDTVERKLRVRFPYEVERHNKSIKVKGNTYRKQVDTVPCFALNYYYNTGNNDYSSYKEGIIIYADDGTVIRNFPKQHIFNGKSKNKLTNYKYKKIVRIIKKMRALMIDFRYSSASKVSSFGLESLLWNPPDEEFTRYYTLGYVVQDIIRYLKTNIGKFDYYKEANGIKPLFASVEEKQNYINFINDLDRFFVYE